MNIYLSGLIGSGKTSIGKPLAEKFNVDFFDLDQTMDERLGYSFHELVAQEGWIPFRELEYSICKDFAKQTNSIVCLGGGTVRYEWNVDVLRPTGVILFLEVSIDELARRVRLADRPRVNPGTTLETDIQLMWEKWGDRYYDSADIIYRAEGKSEETEVDELFNMIIYDPRFAGFQVNGSGASATAAFGDRQGSPRDGERRG